MIDFLARIWASAEMWLIGAALTAGYVAVVLGALYLLALAVVYGKEWLKVRD